MNADLKRFHATFFEESREGLDAMESGLLALESGRGETETINTVFRAAHSIKGGAATFGFTAVTELTHRLETLLDALRSGKRALETEAVDAMLASVDVLRALLAAAESGDAAPAGPSDEIAARLDAVLAGEAAPAAKPVQPARDDAPDRWQVRFAPMPSLFLSGNDPLRIVRELAELGPLAANCDLTRLPAFAGLDPLEAYLAWDLTLPGSVARGQIADAFAWVEDECELRIEAQRDAKAAAPVTAAAAPAEPVASSARAGAGDVPMRRESDVDSSIRVNTAKVDVLINLVGELVITQAMLKQVGDGAEQIDSALSERLLHGLEQLERNTRELQEAVISVRMLPMDAVFRRFPRLVRDLSARLGKQVRLVTSGEATELDKGLIERIVDPLVHLVRNAVDHGLEPPEARRAAGKNETGTVTLSAAHQGGSIVIEVADDGRGLNRDRILAKAAERGVPVPDNATDAQVWELIFHPGFSTAETITDVSGRGVGMDVVRQNILALGGEVALHSETGRGTRVMVRLPLTLAIVDGMSVSVGGETYILPLGFVLESLQVRDEDVRTVGGQGRLLRVRGDYIPLFSLAELYGLQSFDIGPRIVVVVESDGRRMALEVDELLGQQQIVVKNLEANYRKVPGVSGATILGDGRVALIVDVGGIARGMARTA